MTNSVEPDPEQKKTYEEIIAEIEKELRYQTIEGEEVDLKAYLPDGGVSRYDYDDNCGLTYQLICEYSEEFRLLDILGVGQIRTSDLMPLLNRCGEHPTQAEYQNVLQQVDPSANGMLNFQQFLIVMSNFVKGVITEEEITEAFQVFDRDNSGSIDSKELRHVLKTLGDKMTEEEANSMIREADKDGDGTVDYKEFVSTILENQ